MPLPSWALTVKIPGLGLGSGLVKIDKKEKIIQELNIELSGLPSNLRSKTTHNYFSQTMLT